MLGPNYDDKENNLIISQNFTPQIFNLSRLAIIFLQPINDFKRLFFGTFE